MGKQKGWETGVKGDLGWRGSGVEGLGELG